MGTLARPAALAVLIFATVVTRVCVAESDGNHHGRGQLKNNLRKISSRQRQADAECKQMLTYADCELLDTVLQTSIGAPKVSDKKHRMHKPSHKCMWCRAGGVPFCTSCSNLEQLEGDGVMCRPFLLDPRRLCDRDISKTSRKLPPTMIRFSQIASPSREVQPKNVSVAKQIDKLKSKTLKDEIFNDPAVAAYASLKHAGVQKAEAGAMVKGKINEAPLAAASGPAGGTPEPHETLGRTAAEGEGPSNPGAEETPWTAASGPTLPSNPEATPVDHTLTSGAGEAPLAAASGPAGGTPEPHETLGRTFAEGEGPSNPGAEETPWTAASGPTLPSNPGATPVDHTPTSGAGKAPLAAASGPAGGTTDARETPATGSDRTLAIDAAHVVGSEDEKAASSPVAEGPGSSKSATPPLPANPYLSVVTKPSVGAPVSGHGPGILKTIELREETKARHKRAWGRVERYRHFKDMAHKKFFCPIDKLRMVESSDIGTTSVGRDAYAQRIKNVEYAAAHVGYFTGLENLQTSLSPSASATFEVTSAEKMPFRNPMQHFFSDIDGRADYGVLAAPGGDLGLLLVALAASERTKKESFEFEQVFAYFQQFLSDMGKYGKQKFAMVMDEQSLQRLAKIAEVVDAMNPLSGQGQDRVISESTRPECIGSQHLRLLVNPPPNSAYRIRPMLAEHLIKSFWSVYFDHRHPMQPTLMVPIMTGTHKEKGVIVSTRTHGDYICQGQSPLLVPTIGTSSFYVYHKGSAERHLQSLSEWALHANIALPRSANGALYSEMVNIADAGWKWTKVEVADGLECFDLSLTSYEGW
jgi:hypothetical protein